MARKLESLFLDGPAGRLEALLEEPENDEPEGDGRQLDRSPREAALVCHPHPQHGGTMHNKVVYRIARGLRRAGAVGLRLN
jgi:alpha/beta superfamily hydrolase